MSATINENTADIMSDHIDKTIADFQKKLAEKEDEAKQIKVAINQMCAVAGRSPIYSDSELQVKSQVAATNSDEFVGIPMATAARRALEIRKASNQDPPATVRELYESLIGGGFLFDTKNEANAMRALRISLSKNTPVFYKLPTGKFGLVSWYGDKIKRASKAGAEKKGGNDIDSSDHEHDDDDASDLIGEED